MAGAFGIAQKSVGKIGPFHPNLKNNKVMNENLILTW